VTKTLRIKNFKSIKNIEITCKKLNVFIGEPNSGKSNIIEALSIMSQGAVNQNISKAMVRYQSMSELFYDFNINKPIEVFTDKMNYWLKYSIREDGVPDNEFNLDIRENLNKNAQYKIAHDGKTSHQGTPIETVFKFYQYERLMKFKLGYFPHLATPNGENLPSLLLSNEELRLWVEEFIESKGFTLTLKPTENEISISKIVKKSIYSYPYFSISETLQRVVFYILAIMSNKKAILLFDEPETNTFPFYTKFLGEHIALDNSNQFFITTHNPYLLLSLIEKSSFENINVCVVKMKDYETKITTLNKKQVGEVLDFNSDVFFNLDRIVD
jgi:AAA15 family ATPase/GTPase